jgi:YHS domain-containing protein
MLAWLLRIVLLAVVVRIVWRFFLGLLDGASGRPASRPGPRVQPTGPMPLIKDPQCGTHVVKERALRTTIGEQVHYFCSEDCRDKYRAAQGRRSA